ncbi:hypothetical protein [Marinobacter pelagius]|uniref:Uncharacterized protein n=1 Tax=Marinobacter pelagius TaxID=379482 RepID=A0A1I4T6B1_9GAMM|nr:hypothetical protein [Marinobacter pelagius]SFM72185.1 hypothetical protein SAMN04487961_1018 [Marinobacter pelagius]
MSTSNRGTDLPQFINDLDGGVFAEKVSRALSDVAAGVIDFDDKGELTIKLKFARIGNSYRVGIKHALTYKVPEANGSYSQENTTESVMHVNSGGRMSMFPENQNQLFTRTGDPQTHPEDRE